MEKASHLQSNLNVTENTMIGKSHHCDWLLIAAQETRSILASFEFETSCDSLWLCYNLFGPHIQSCRTNMPSYQISHRRSFNDSFNVAGVLILETSLTSPIFAMSWMILFLVLQRVVGSFPENLRSHHDLDPLLSLQPWQVHEHPGVQGFQFQLHFPVFQAVVPVLSHSLGTRVEVFEPLGIGFIFGMLQHLIPAYASGLVLLNN